MSGLTSELALGTAVGGDDTANYLTITLASALNTIDGEFSSSTGHNHSGAHQGGVLHFTNLLTNMITFDNGATLGPFSTGTTLRFQSINVTHSGNISADGNATITGTLGVTGATTLGTATVTTANVTTLAVGGPSTLNGTVSANAISASTVSTSGRITSGTDMLITNGTLYLHPSGDTVIARGGAGLVSMQALTLSQYLTVAGTTTLNGDLASNFGQIHLAPGVAGGAALFRGDIASAGLSNKTLFVTESLQVFWDIADVGHDIHANNGAMFAHAFNVVSDPRLKGTMTALTPAQCLADVLDPRVQPYTYPNIPESTPPSGYVPTHTPADPDSYGFSATEMAEVCPEVVTLDQDQQPALIAYTSLIPILWGALRQLDARVQALES